MPKIRKTKAGSPKNSDISREIHHLGVKIETVNDNVKLVAEQYGDIKGDIKGIKGEIGGIKEEIGSIKDTLDTHTDMIGSMKEDIEIIKMNIEFIKGSVKKKVDVEEFSALERRVTLLEKRR